MSKIYIVAAKRTPQGRFMGALTKRSAVDLAVAAAQAALKDIGAAKIDQVIIGNVLSAGRGMNIARQVAVKVGVPLEQTAFTVNMMCASGMQAIILAAQAVTAGSAHTVLCGGTESMSNAPYLLERARSGYKLGDGVLVDTLLRDGLVDTFDNEHMGLHAERLAEQYKIGRSAQDEFAAQSQAKYHTAHTNGLFADELVPLPELDKDEHPRYDATIDQLAALKPAFKKDGTVTPGNASGINDGAAMLVVCDEKALRENSWKPLAEISASASVGCDPRMMALGPVYATQKLCKLLGVGVDAFDTVELNEAFAVQSLACIQDLNLDAQRVNPEGGAIALGHPIGASGARIIVHLAHRIAQGRTKTGLATLCIGGGMGSAVVLCK